MKNNRKPKALSLALAMILSLTLVMSLTVTGAAAKTKAKKKTVYVLVSSESKQAKKGDSMSTKLKYNKNGSVKLITSNVKKMEPANPPKDGETPQSEPPAAPGDKSANPPAPPSDFKEVKFKRTIKVAYLKNKKVASIKSYKDKSLLRSLKYHYSSKTGLMNSIKFVEQSEFYPTQKGLFKISKRDKKKRIDTMKRLTDGKKTANVLVKYKYNKKNLPTELITTVFVNNKPVSAPIKLKYDKHNSIIKGGDSMIMTNKYNKKGLLVKQIKKEKEPHGLFEEETLTFKYKKIKVSSDVAAAVKKQQWAIQSMEELNTPVYDEMLFYTK